MKTGCVLSLTLFPQMYMMERIGRSETAIVLSHPVVGEENPVNKCSIRTAMDKVWFLTVPVLKNRLPADKCAVVPQSANWRQYLMKDVTRAYGGLLHFEEAVELTDKCVVRDKFEWLTDVLMSGFMRLLREVGWDREVYRGDSLQRRRYRNESEFLLNLALEAEIDKLIVGSKQMYSLDQRLFRRNGVELSVQHWKKPEQLRDRDSVLDVVARYGLLKVKEML